MVRPLASTLLALALAVPRSGGEAFAGTQYRAEPASPAAAGRLIVKGIVWKCGAGGCVALQGNRRAGLDCSALAREVGALRSFTVGGQPLDPESLGKCNARVR